MNDSVAAAGRVSPLRRFVLDISDTGILSSHLGVSRAGRVVLAA